MWTVSPYSVCIPALAAILLGCTPDNRPVVLQPLDWTTVNQIANAALEDRFPQVEKNHVRAQDFRVYIYGLDHNGDSTEKFLQSFDYIDAKKSSFVNSPPSIGCTIMRDGNVSIPESRTFPFRPVGTNPLHPLKLSGHLKTPDFEVIDNLAKSALSDKVDPKYLVFVELSVGYQANLQKETYTIMYYDSSSIKTEFIDDRKTLFYKWVRIKLNAFGDVVDILWHTPSINIEGKTDAQIQQLPHPPASVPWPPNH